jgi:hypothetical protein
MSAGAVSAEKVIRKAWAQILLALFLVMLTIPILPIGLPVYKTQGLIAYFKELQDKYGTDVGRRWEDGVIHSLPQDYADMLGWEELAAVTNKGWNGITDKKAAFIYCENYGQAGAITIIGKKYGLPEAISFNESFRYWIPEKFDPDPTAFIYINDEMGEDVRTLFRKITVVGSITNPYAREYGTTVYLCEEPVMSFNEFWGERLKKLNEESGY